MTIGEKLKYFREIYKVTQDDIVELLKSNNYEISKSTYCRYERDESLVPFDFIPAFILVLKDKQFETNFKDKPISIFSFLYNDVDKEDAEDKKRLEIINKALFNITAIPKQFDKTMFGEIFDLDKPFLQIFYSMPEFNEILQVLEQDFKLYRENKNKLNDIDKEIAKICGNDKNKIKSYKEKNEGYKTLLNKTQRCLRDCKTSGGDFILLFLDYYCKL